MVKKIICIILILGAFIMTSCKNENLITESEIEVGKYSFDATKIKSEGNGIWPISTVINDETFALKYAEMVMKAYHQDLTSYKIRSVSYDDNKEVWIVHFMIDENTLGGNINVAISKKSGEVLLMWSEE